MKIYDLYHEPTDDHYYFARDPRKYMTVVEMAKFLLKKTNEYGIFVEEKFADWYIKKFGEPVYDKLAHGSPKKFQEQYFKWIEETYSSTAKFLDDSEIYVRVENVIE